MRKRIVAQAPHVTAADDEPWLPLESLAVVEVTSEDPAHPIESALLPDGAGSGWRAAAAGKQTLRIIFDTPQRVSRIHLAFEERQAMRMQEFVLSWSPAGESGSREIVRQQYNFSPPATTREVEDYRVQLNAVGALELTILPDAEGGLAFASLQQLRVSS